MTRNEYEPFSACMQQVAETYGRRLTEGAMLTYWAALERFPLGAIRTALNAHIADADGGRFMPLPAHLIAQLQAHDGRPTADEAWAEASKAVDEAASVVWTAETAAAYWECACPLLQLRDEVAARRAFIDRYQRLVQEARSRLEPVRWEFVAGTDRERQAQALSQAVTLRRISDAEAHVKCPALPSSAPLAALISDSGIGRRLEQKNAAEGVKAASGDIVADETATEQTPIASQMAARLAGLRATLRQLDAARSGQQQARQNERAQTEDNRLRQLRQAGLA